VCPLLYFRVEDGHTARDDDDDDDARATHARVRDADADVFVGVGDETGSRVCRRARAGASAADARDENVNDVDDGWGRRR